MYNKMDVQKASFDHLFWTLEEKEINFAPNTSLAQHNNVIMSALNNGRGLIGRLYVISQKHSEGPAFSNLFNEIEYKKIDHKWLITPIQMLLNSSKLVQDQILSALLAFKPTIHNYLIQVMSQQYVLEDFNKSFYRENRLNEFFGTRHTLWQDALEETQSANQYK